MPSEAWETIFNPNWFTGRVAEVIEAEEVYLQEQEEIRKLLAQEGYLQVTYHEDGTLTFAAVITGQPKAQRCPVCGAALGHCIVDCRLGLYWIQPGDNLFLNDFAKAVL